MDLRVLPSFVVHSILKSTLLVLGILLSHFQDFGFIEKFSMETEGFLILLVERLALV